MDKEYYWIHQKRFHFIEKEIDKLKLPSQSKILDIGCYPPFLFNSLRAKGYDLFGISSLHEPYHDKQVIALNIEKDILPYKLNTFDLVLLTEVIEHLVDGHHHLFQEIYRVLKPGGYFLLTTPNVHRLANIISLLFKKNIYFPLDQMLATSRDADSLNHRHNREFTLGELLTLSRIAGFTVVFAGYFNSLHPTRRRLHSESRVKTIGKLLVNIFTFFLPFRRDSLVIILKKN